jgi:predicted amidohydrolase
MNIRHIKRFVVSLCFIAKVALMKTPISFSFLLSSALLALLPLGSAAADKTFEVATLKSMPVTGDKAANYAVFEKYARQAAAAGASMIVVPECYLDGYLGHPKFVPGMTREKLAAMGEKIDGPWVTKAEALARELGIYVLFGFSERRGDKNYNTIAIIDPEGKLVGRYSKSHPAGGELYDAGGELPVFDTKLGRMGVLICFDRQPPENARTLALKGAQFIVVPAYGKTSTPMDEDILLRARAYENGVYVVYTSPRNAFVAGPDGAIIAQVRNDQDELLLARLTLDGRIGDRNAIKVRHPELYGRLVESAAPVKQP